MNYQIIDNVTGHAVTGSTFPDEDSANHLCQRMNLAAGNEGRFKVAPVNDAGTGAARERMTRNIAEGLRMCSDEALFELMDRWSNVIADARALQLDLTVIRALREVVTAAEAEARIRGLSWLATT